MHGSEEPVDPTCTRLVHKQIMQTYNFTCTQRATREHQLLPSVTKILLRILQVVQTY